MQATIHVFYAGSEAQSQSLTAESGTSLATALRAGGLLDLPCGVGRCGKCLVYTDSPPSDEDVKRLNSRAIAAGMRLACHTPVVDGLKCTLPEKTGLSVLTDFARGDYPFAPLVSHEPLCFTPPTLEDQRPDIERLMAACGADRHALSLELLAGLPAFMREEGDRYALKQGGELLGYTHETRHLAFIVDIGTTTVAALLTDLQTRDIPAVSGEKNAQASFGADVISRIHSSLEEGTEPLRRAIATQLDNMLKHMLRRVGASDVSCVALAGNCTMLHTLCGFSAEHISRAPFIPVTTEALRLPASRLGLSSQAPAFLLPGISAYIGADIVASLLAADAHTARESFLLVDFGTNAETVLFANGVLYACSAAAGPCFEGATLSSGMAGQQGAVDSVFFTSEGFSHTVIGNVPAKGICGSGVIDAVSLLLESGYLDASGRLAPGEVRGADSVRGHLHPEKGFCLAPGVSLTQKDIREIQLAKAAVRAGIEVLLKQAGIAAHQVQTLYLAGGFGSTLNPESAARIGLIPRIPANKVRVLGNASCFGTLRYATEQNAEAHAQKIIKGTHYIELSNHSDFFEEYILRMTFPDADEKDL